MTGVEYAIYHLSFESPEKHIAWSEHLEVILCVHTVIAVEWVTKIEFICVPREGRGS